jgi:hypothetical protein
MRRRPPYSQPARPRWRPRRQALLLPHGADLSSFPWRRSSPLAVAARLTSSGRRDHGPGPRG